MIHTIFHIYHTAVLATAIYYVIQFILQTDDSKQFIKNANLMMDSLPGLSDNKLLVGIILLLVFVVSIYINPIYFIYKIIKKLFPNKYR